MPQPQWYAVFSSRHAHYSEYTVFLLRIHNKRRLREHQTNKKTIVDTRKKENIANQKNWIHTSILKTTFTT